ncbi:MAG: Ig-like domain-containing protein [Cyclobacteriaceae bacterium]
MRILNCAINLLTILCIVGCANVSTPTGGPRDEQAPELLSAIPRDNSTEVRSRDIVLEFDEDVRLDNLSQQLIITPRLDIAYKSQVKRNIVTLQFEENLPDNTTFTFSFREAIKDITEGNAAENLTLAFSTGPYIDSLTLSGNVNDLLTGKPVEKATLGLYQVGDTITIFNGKPYYFTQSNASGQFTFENLKEGQYHIYAWNDKNENLELDGRNEAYAFRKDLITIESSDSISALSLVQIDYRDLASVYSRPSGTYYDLKFNKGITDYTVTYPSADTLVSMYKPDQNLIRWYPSQVRDSIQAYITVSDSIMTDAWTDTLYIKFNAQSRSKPEAFTYKTEPTSSKITRNQSFDLSFSKPVISVNKELITFRFDSLNVLPSDSLTFDWNNSRTKLTLKPDLKERPLNVYDSINTPLNNLPDSATEEEINILRNQVNQFNSNSGKTFEIVLEKGAFVSMQSDSSEAKLLPYTFSKPSDYAVIAGTINTEKPAYIVQLINSNSEVVKEVRNEASYRFTNVPPGDYTIRVLIDTNGNGRWDPGNILENQLPEPVYFYEKVIPLKANWEVVDENLSF